MSKNLLKLLLFSLAFVQISHARPLLRSGDEQLSRARQLVQKGEYQKAVERFKKLAAESAFATHANIELARVYLQIGDYAPAEEMARQVLQDAKHNADALHVLGLALKKTGRYAEARAAFEKAVSQNPNHLAARLNLGIMQYEWGERTAARETLRFFISYYRTHRDLQADEIATIAHACVYLDRFRDANDLFYQATKADPELWQAYVQWGELFLSKYNIPDASSTFEDALKVNPKAAEAHLGLARCWRQNNFEQARAAAAEALETNPNLVAAHNLLAEIEIVIGDYRVALERLQTPLQTNPNALQSRALRAVCFYFLNEHETFTQEIERVLDINPHDGDLYFEIAEALSKRYLFAESVDYYRKALALDPDHYLARAGLGTSLSRLGREAEAKQELEQAFNRDPYNKYVGNLLTLFDEYPKYRTFEREHLRIRMHERDAPVLATYAVELASQSFSQLRQRYNFDVSQPVTLEIFPEHDDFAVRCFGLPGAQAFLGICFGNVVAMDSPRARTKGDFVWGETLWHEMVHVSHLRMTRNRIPRWLAEGIAVYETSRANPHWSMNLDLPFIMAFQNDRLLPLRDLDAGFNRPRSPGQVTLSYFQASQVVEFIEQAYGHEKLVQTFPKFRSGMTTPEVIQQVFAKDIDALDEEFRTYVTQKYRLDSVDYSYDPHAVSEGEEDVEKRLTEKLADNPNNPFLNFRLGLYYKEEGAFDKAVMYLQKARDLFPYFVGSNNPYSALAEVYLESGQKERAIEQLRQLVARHGKDMEVLQRLTKLALESGRYGLAIETFEKILYIAPFESDVHRKLARAYLATGRTDAAIQELRIHLKTQPSDLAGAHCDLAEALLQAGQKAEAKESALMALEIAPNYERAQQILLASIE